MYHASRFGTTVVVGLLIAWTVTIVPGCAAVGRRGPPAEKVAACRDLTRQAVAAMELGHMDEAELLLREALRASPEDAVAHRHLAEVLWRRGDHQEALPLITAATRFDSDDARLAVRAGEMLLSTGAHEAALTHAEEAIRLDPQLAGAWALRGRAFWQIHQADRALADLQRSLEFAPNDTGVLLDVAAIYHQRGQPSRCLTTLHHLRESYSAGEEPQTALLLEGQSLLKLGRPRRAADVLLAATDRGPPNVEVLYHLAQAQSADGRYAEAAAAAQQALALDGSHQASRQLLARLAAHAAAGDTQRQ